MMNLYNLNIHNRRSIRLKGYDYSKPGMYFITLCCWDMACLFGDVVDEKMVLNDAGKIANDCWIEIPEHFPNVKLHEYVIMPNHAHGIIKIVSDPTAGATPNAGANVCENVTLGANGGANVCENMTVGANGGANVCENMTVGANGGAKNFSPLHFSPLRSPSKTIGSIVRGFKIGVTKWMRQNTDTYFVWQRDYYDIIIRNEQSYKNIARYIINNPAKWAQDRFFGK